jgi:hypothetical protein
MDGQTYLLEHIYGVDEQEDGERSQMNDDARDCVVCIADPATVAVLPCRHLCLCSDCAEELRSRSCFCPICRQGEWSLEVNVEHTWTHNAHALISQPFILCCVSGSDMQIPIFLMLFSLLRFYK